MQTAGMEGEQVYFVLEDYQILHPEFLDMVNSLLSSGEVNVYIYLGFVIVLLPTLN